MKQTDARRDQILELRYGLPRGGFDWLLARQDGVCAVCHEEDPRGRLYLDHDSETGVIRGLLCNLCNVAIGMLLHDPERIRAAADYIERQPPEIPNA